VVELDFDEYFEYVDDFEIRLPVDVHLPAGALLRTDAVLDTGASLSVFGSTLLEALGIFDVTSGHQTSLALATGLRIAGYVHNMRITLVGRVLVVPVFFSLDLPADIDNLLGIYGVLEQLDIAILHRERRLYVRS
jgi:hypothetical protein